MARTFFDRIGKSIRRTLITDSTEVRKLKAEADALQAALDDPELVKEFGKCTVEMVDSAAGFNAMFPHLEDANGGDIWGAEGLLGEIVDLYESKTGQKHRDV